MKDARWRNRYFWPLVAVVMLLAFPAWAQVGFNSPVSSNGIQSPSFQPAAIPLLVTRHQRYSSLRRGDEQELALVICTARPKLRFCPDSGNPLPSRLVPVAFQLSSQSEFVVRYWDGEKYRKAAKATPIEDGDRQVILLKIRASDHALPGSYLLSGRLRLRLGDQGPGGVWSDNTNLQDMQLNIMVNVVDRDARISEAHDWPTETHFARDLKSGIAGFLRAVPEVTFIWAFCRINGCDDPTLYQVLQ